MNAWYAAALIVGVSAVVAWVLALVTEPGGGGSDNCGEDCGDDDVGR